VQRLVGRGLPEDDARRRIASQAGDAERRAAADVWLDNAGTPQDLEHAVDRLRDQRLLPFRDNLLARRAADEGPVPPGAAGRLADRVRLALDGLAVAVGASGPVGVRVEVAGGLAPDDVVARLGPAGVVPVAEPALLRSCDPGAPVRVDLVPPGQGGSG
jgi:dephospho-CoA kinase